MFEKIKNILNSQFFALSLYSRTIAGTIVLFIIARYLTVYDYGLFSSYKNIAAFCFMFANLGFNEYILVSSKANHNAARLKISLFLINAILIAILICIGATFCNLESTLLFWLVAIRAFFDGTFFALILPYFQATKKFNVIATVNIVYACCTVVIAIISYLFKLSLIKFLILSNILGFINFVQCSYYAKINYFLFFNNISRYLSLLDKTIFSYMGVAIAYFLYSQVPSLYVSTYLPKEQAALYFAAFTIATIISLVIGAQVQKMTPEMIKADKKEIKNIIKTNLIFIISVTSVLLLIMIIIGKGLLQLLYGKIYYANAYHILLILMLGNIGIAEASVYGAYITASGNQKMKIPKQLEATVVTVISLLVLHRYGIYGAALSYFMAACYIAIGYTTRTHYLLKHNCNK